MVSKWERKMLADIGGDVRKAVSWSWKNDPLSFWTGIIFTIDVIVLAYAIHCATWTWILGVTILLGASLGPLFRLQARRWAILRNSAREAETDLLR